MKKAGQNEFAEGLRKYPLTTPKPHEAVTAPPKEDHFQLKSRLS